MLAVAYEKTQELARDLRAVGCGDLDVEGNELTHLVPYLSFCNSDIKLQRLWKNMSYICLMSCNHMFLVY